MNFFYSKEAVWEYPESTDELVGRMARELEPPPNDNREFGTFADARNQKSGTLVGSTAPQGFVVRHKEGPLFPLIWSLLPTPMMAGELRPQNGGTRVQIQRTEAISRNVRIAITLAFLTWIGVCAISLRWQEAPSYRYLTDWWQQKRTLAAVKRVLAGPRSSST